MRVKLYRAAGMSAAMALIRGELGPEAMILATRRVAEGIEVTAALEEDASAPADADNDFEPDAVPTASTAPTPLGVRSYPEVLDDTDGTQSLGISRQTQVLYRGPNADDWASLPARPLDRDDGFAADRPMAAATRLASGKRAMNPGLDTRAMTDGRLPERGLDRALPGGTVGPADWSMAPGASARQDRERSPDRTAVLRAVAAAGSTAQSRARERPSGFDTGAGTSSRVVDGTQAKPRPQSSRGFEAGAHGGPLAAGDAARRVSAMAWHGVPPAIAARLSAGPLAFALSITLPFASLDLDPGGAPLLLAGPPGAGKTLTTARLATRLVLAGCKPLVITADGRRAGATEQLAAFTRLLGLHLLVASTPAALQRALARRQHGEPVLIDGPGIDPFIPAQLEELASLATSVAAVTAFVCPAGLDPNEAADLASVHRGRGATLLIANRLDTGRRLGGVLAAADAGLSLTQAGIGPGAADGLVPLTPEMLATRLITLPDRSS